MSKTPITRYGRGTVILNQGETEHTLCKILSGTVAIYLHYGQPEECMVGSLTAPHFFGETAVLTDWASLYTAVAHTDVLIMHIPREAFEGFVKGDPRNALGLMREMADRFVTLNLFVRDVETAVKDSPMDENVLHFLMEQYAASDRVDLGGLRVSDARTLPTPPALAMEYNSLFLPGHKGYPDHTHPEYRTYLFEKKYTCPHCKQKFEGLHTFYADTKLVAVPNPKASLYDLRIFYKDFEVEWYEIITCPHCLFSALDSFFTEFKYLHRHRYEEELLRVRESIWLDFSAERDLDFVFAQHYLALLCAPAFTDTRQITAHLWLNLCWLYRSCGDEEMADRAQDKALEAYKTVYYQCGLKPTQEQHACLLIAGMLYRMGEKQAAREWAVRVRHNRAGKSAYSNLAEALIGDIRLEMEIEAADAKAAAEAQAAAARAAAKAAAEAARIAVLEEARKNRVEFFSSLIGRGKDGQLVGDSGL